MMKLMIHLVTGSGAESHEYKEWDVVTSFCSAEQLAFQQFFCGKIQHYSPTRVVLLVVISS